MFVSVKRGVVSILDDDGRNLQADGVRRGDFIYSLTKENKLEITDLGARLIRAFDFFFDDLYRIDGPQLVSCKYHRVYSYFEIGCVSQVLQFNFEQRQPFLAAVRRNVDLSEEIASYTINPRASCSSPVDFAQDILHKLKRQTEPFPNDLFAYISIDSFEKAKEWITEYCGLGQFDEKSLSYTSMTGYKISLVDSSSGVTNPLVRLVDEYGIDVLSGVIAQYYLDITKLDQAQISPNIQVHLRSLYMVVDNSVPDATDEPLLLTRTSDPHCYFYLPCADDCDHEGWHEARVAYQLFSALSEPQKRELFTTVHFFKQPTEISYFSRKDGRICDNSGLPKEFEPNDYFLPFFENKYTQPLKEGFKSENYFFVGDLDALEGNDHHDSDSFNFFLTYADSNGQRFLRKVFCDSSDTKPRAIFVIAQLGFFNTSEEEVCVNLTAFQFSPQGDSKESTRVISESGEWCACGEEFISSLRLLIPKSIKEFTKHNIMLARVAT